MRTTTTTIAVAIFGLAFANAQTCFTFSIVSSYFIFSERRILYISASISILLSSFLMNKSSSILLNRPPMFSIFIINFIRHFKLDSFFHDLMFFRQMLSGNIHRGWMCLLLGWSRRIRPSRVFCSRTRWPFLGCSAPVRGRVLSSSLVLVSFWVFALFRITHTEKEIVLNVICSGIHPKEI